MLTKPLAGALGAALLLASITACSSGEDRFLSTGGPPSPGPVSARPIADFELYVQASAENNPLFADVYGIELEPLAAYRLTSGKRISVMDANADQVVVAAADGDIDRLGYVQDGGEIGPIPGLGRPYAFAPIFDRDGDIFFEDYIEVGPDKRDITRFFEWNPEVQTRKLILKTRRDDLYGPVRGTDGELVFIGGEEDAELLIIDRRERRRTLQLPREAVSFFMGERWIALEIDAPDSRFGDKPTDLVLLDPDTGKRKRVASLQPITWTPDGTRLLVRKTADPRTSELALLDPADPEALEVLGTIPNLTIYNGAWVDRG